MYRMIRFIRYTHSTIRFMSIYDMPVRYGTFYTYTRYDTYCVSYNTNNYGNQLNIHPKKKKVPVKNNAHLDGPGLKFETN